LERLLDIIHFIANAGNENKSEVKKCEKTPNVTVLLRNTFSFWNSGVLPKD
jgi:hypothetical protein